MWCKQTNLGCHWSIDKTLAGTLEGAYCAGCYTPQLFMGSPYTLNRRKISSEDISAANAVLKSTGQNVFTHLPYVYNLAGSAKKNKLAFADDQEVTDYTLQCCRSISEEIRTLDKLQCRQKGCVIHIGSSTYSEGLATVAKSINQMELQDSCPLLLETMVGRGNVLGKTFEELVQVRESVEKKSAVGFCVDTCHIFAQGLYEMASVESVDKLFEDMERVLKRANVKLVHLNDSVADFSALVDNHARVGQGKIWSHDIKPLKYLIKRFTDWDVPLVLETQWRDLEVVHCL